MGKARSNSAPVSVDAVIDSLTNQGIAFRGPFCTHLNRVFSWSIGTSFWSLSSSICLSKNKLNRDDILELGKRIEASSH